MTLVKSYDEICKTWKNELKEAFEPYFIEQCLDNYLRGLYDCDDVAVIEVMKENMDFIEGYLMDKLGDE